MDTMSGNINDQCTVFHLLKRKLKIVTEVQVSVVVNDTESIARYIPVKNIVYSSSKLSFFGLICRIRSYCEN